MQKEFTLTAFEDHNGALGWGIGELDNTFDEIDACYEGRLLAHDLLEHNHNSSLQGVTNELEALGAAEYVRGCLELEHDILNMAREVAYNPIDVPRGTMQETHFDCFAEIACKAFNSEVGLSDLDTEKRKNLRDYIKYAGQHMQNGNDWASEHYKNVDVNRMFSEIESSFCSAEFEGEQAVIMLDFEQGCATWHDNYDLYELEED